MSEYYAVQRSEEFLAHYGVRGMKWGVRKAVAKGKHEKLGKVYRKAAKKLAKLEKQAASGGTYAKRAARLGVAAGAAGALAYQGTGGVAKGLHKLGEGALKGGFAAGTALTKYKGAGSKYTKAVGSALQKASGRSSAELHAAGKAIDAWGNKSHSLYSTTLEKAGIKYPKRVTNNTLARAGAGLVGAGLAGAAGYNAYRAATTKRAAKKAANFRSEMQKAFKGTEYENRMPAQYQPKKRRRSRQA